jgi:release factor glutamine methyltransferase
MKVEPEFDVPGLIGWAADYLSAKRIVKPRLNAEQLLSHCTGRDRVHLYAYPEKSISEEEKESFVVAVMRRASREPLQYIVGLKGFRHLDLAVDRRVLIPRPETEMMVGRALELLNDIPGHPVAVDIGTGSGCIALSVSRECPAAVVHATDICDSALEVAAANALRLGLDGTVVFHRGDLIEALPAELKGKCDLILSNPPYIKKNDFLGLPPEVREHEPYGSLVAGPMGTEVHLRLMQQAGQWLSPRGWLLMEGGEDQMEVLAGWAGKLGFGAVRVLSDLNGLPRVIEMRPL